MNFGTGLGYPVSVQLDATICSQSPVTVVCFKNVKSDLGVSYPDIELLKAVLKAAEHVLYKLATVCIAHWTARHHPTWLQTSDGCHLSDMPSRRRLRSSLTHQLDVHQSQCAINCWRPILRQSPRRVLGCGKTVCQQTLLHVTHFHSSTENLKHFYLVFLRGSCGFYLERVLKNP